MTISMNNISHSHATHLSHQQIAHAVAVARHAVGYTVDDLAVTTGLVVEEIEQIENGQDADPAKLKRIAVALQVPVSSLLPS